LSSVAQRLRGCFREEEQRRIKLLKDQSEMVDDIEKAAERNNDLEVGIGHDELSVFAHAVLC
jgi:hypothetical protein